MKFIFLDYSQKFTGTPAEVKKCGKFVQIRSCEAEFMVFSTPQVHPYHANIVEKFCLEKSGLRGHYNSKRDNFIIDSPGWSVRGGGIWEIDTKKRTLRLMGRSLAYGPFEQTGLKENLARAKPGYSIEINCCKL